MEKLQALVQNLMDMGLSREQAVAYAWRITNGEPNAKISNTRPISPQAAEFVMQGMSMNDALAIDHSNTGGDPVIDRKGRATYTKSPAPLQTPDTWGSMTPPIDDGSFKKAAARTRPFNEPAPLPVLPPMTQGKISVDEGSYLLNLIRQARANRGE
jgi:hypothetical protein